MGSRVTGVLIPVSLAGLAESNSSLLPGLWRDSLHVTCGLTACTPGSAPGPTLGNKYGKTLPFYLVTPKFSASPSGETMCQTKTFWRTNNVLEVLYH